MTRHNSTTDLTKKKLKQVYAIKQGPVVQSVVSLTSLLMTNSVTVVAKVFSNALIFLQCKGYSHFSSKNTDAFAIFQDRNFNVTLALSLNNRALVARKSKHTEELL